MTRLVGSMRFVRFRHIMKRPHVKDSLDGWGSISSEQQGLVITYSQTAACWQWFDLWNLSDQCVSPIVRQVYHDAVHFLHWSYKHKQVEIIKSSRHQRSFRLSCSRQGIWLCMMKSNDVLKRKEYPFTFIKSINFVPILIRNLSPVTGV